MMSPRITCIQFLLHFSFCRKRSYHTGNTSPLQGSCLSVLALLSDRVPNQVCACVHVWVRTRVAILHTLFNLKVFKRPCYLRSVWYHRPANAVYTAGAECCLCIQHRFVCSLSVQIYKLQRKACNKWYICQTETECLKRYKERVCHT